MCVVACQRQHACTLHMSINVYSHISVHVSLSTWLCLHVLMGLPPRNLPLILDLCTLHFYCSIDSNRASTRSPRALSCFLSMGSNHEGSSMLKSLFDWFCTKTEDLIQSILLLHDYTAKVSQLQDKNKWKFANSTTKKAEKNPTKHSNQHPSHINIIWCEFQGLIWLDHRTLKRF